MAEVKMDYSIDPKKYPSNSKATKQAPKPKEEVKSVVSGTVKVKKPNELQKAARTFFSTDGKNVFSYIVNDVLVPAAKDMLFEMITGSASMSLFGEDRRRKGYGRGGSGSRIDYRGISYGPKREERSARDRSSKFDLDDIVFENRSDASEVLDSMITLLETYESCSVADLLSASGINDYPHTAFKFGWTNLGSADVKRVYGGYILDLPNPKPLD